MDSLFLLVPLSLGLLLLSIQAFRWAVRSGQFDDLERHGQDILYPDPADSKTSTSTSTGSDPANPAQQDVPGHGVNHDH